MTIIEATSGNTGIALAKAGKDLGYNIICVMPQKIVKEKQEKIEFYGATVIRSTNAEKNQPGNFIDLAKTLGEHDKNIFYLNQFNNQNNIKAHYSITGPEILKQMKGKIDYLFLGMGTGGTISGVSQFLLEQNNEMKIIGIQPEGSVYKEFKETGKIQKNEKKNLIEGVGYDFIPNTLKLENITKIMESPNIKSIQMTRYLNKIGLPVGGSSGLVMLSLLRTIKDLKKPTNVVTIFPDSKDRYEKTYLNDEWLEKKMKKNETETKKILNLNEEIENIIKD